MNKYNTLEDEEFRKAILYDTNIAKQTKKTYKKTIDLFTKIIDKPYTEIINEIKEEQHDRIEGNTIIKYDPNSGKVKDYILKFLNHCREKGNKESTISIREKHIRTILKKSNVELPDIQIKYKKSSKRKSILTREDIQYVINNSNIHHKALIAFAGCTGLRISDLLKLTIEDFMEATRGHHNYYEVDEFIEQAPYGMMGFWNITPQKTQSIDLECRVCNTPESSNYILDSLTERKDFLLNEGLKLDFDDALFASRNGKYKKPYSYSSLSPLFSKKNKMLFDYKKKEIDNLYKSHIISRREYKTKLANMPKFHAHALRHFFTTTVRAYTTNRDVSLIMEGHSSPYSMDKHYVGSNEYLFSDDTIKETYTGIIDYLTFDKKVDLDEYIQLKETENKYKETIVKTEKLEQKYDELSKLFSEIVNMQEDSVWNKLK